MDSENDCQFRMPLINDDAPAFKAVTTQGEISFPEDYKGKWVILFSHPADFTPVCTTEFMTFASMIDEFKALNTELIGLSVDSLYAHIAWLRKIQELEWNGISKPEVTFPLIEDIKMDVARKYGMIQPGASTTQAVRSVFFIDPKGKIRAIIYYPLSLGRNFDEIKRVILALQKADSDNCASFPQPDPAGPRRSVWSPRTPTCTASTGSCASGNRRRTETRTNDQTGRVLKPRSASRYAMRPPTIDPKTTAQ